MKHKVGDKVRIRKDLKVGERYDGVIVREEMIELVGKTLTISDVHNFGEDDIDYYLNEDENCYYWTDSMFEDAMTNADKIRNMKDEELADFLKETVISCRENLFLCRECNKYGKCSTALKDCTNFITWLQSTKK